MKKCNNYLKLIMIFSVFNGICCATKDLEDKLFIAITSNDSQFIQDFLTSKTESEILQLSELLGDMLICAVEEERDHIIDMLLYEGANINFQDGNGETALMSAVSGRSQKIVIKLLDRGAHVNLQDRWGVTALMLAVLNNNIKIAKILLEARANVSLKDRNGNTAFNLSKDASMQKLIKSYEVSSLIC